MPTHPITAVIRTHRGIEISLRPLHPDDKELLEEGFQGLSDHSRHMRFLTPTNRLTRHQLAYLCEVDQWNHFAWGALDAGGRPVAVVRFVRLAHSPLAADVAVTVADDLQGQGVGRALIQALAAAARSREVEIFEFDLLAENASMLGLLRSLGAERHPSGTLIHATLRVADVPPPDVVWGDVEVRDVAPRRVG